MYTDRKFKTKKVLMLILAGVVGVGAYHLAVILGAPAPIAFWADALGGAVVGLGFVVKVK